MSTPTISVVVPAYNNGRTLDETLRSVLDQDVSGLELIVADHSSSDDTAAVMSRFADDDRVTLLSTPAGGGAGRNWNRVTEAASGEFIKLVCGDDVLRPGVLKRQVEILRGSGAVLTACRRDVVDSEGRVVVKGWGLRGIGRPMPGKNAVRAAVRAGSNLFGEPASVMMRREALTETGGWFDRFPYLIDQATYSRVLLHGSFAPDSTVGATFRMSASQWSVALVREQSGQARAFHAWVRSRYPDVVTAGDVRMGDLRAGIMARARRLSYGLLKRRMR
ncbi:glycosyltransferase family 2 protein [Microbacterium sp. ET2]|uniref:glycosyltransferase family 2 protein n=1 Tax=Microbacterium albipurpureum TaxID=3050384 RepID=UPI00259CF6A2|nr:glycosyltransferase family 2 protein [Microbacterium sp. ET2 (Ac-2212)]WJL95104.1 glycosyltransferase family 2 protein [Microbacterium sp. ET2 (Ac-2212)]